MKKTGRGASNLSREEIIVILKKELPGLKKDFGVKSIMLYGSYAKGKQKRTSDIDILVDFKETPGLTFVSLADRLEDILGKKVDLATFAHYRGSFNNPRHRHIAEDIEKSLIHV
jgi:uncharacterized protein